MKYAFAPVLALALSAVGCTKQSEKSVPASMMSSMDMPSLPPGNSSGEKADFQVKGDTVFVNNKLCATSRSPLKEEQLGEFTSRVVYHGKEKAFDGKTLVFNQCCGMCAGSFPDKWAKSKDEIMRFHGLASNN